MGAKSSKKKKNPAILTEDEINLLLSNTSFTREEIQKWHQGFIHDCNGNLNCLNKQVF